MKLAYLLLALGIVAAASQVQAADEVAPLVVTRSSASSMVEPVPYSYGMALDIAQVVSIDEPQELSCDVATATMVYKDSSNTSRAISYLKVPSSCSNWG